MAEVAPAGGSSVNRNFLFIVGGLAALLVIGLVAFGLLLFLPGLAGNRQQAAVALTAMTSTPVRIAPTATRTVPPPTSTAVIVALQVTSTATQPAPSPTAKPSPATATPLPPTPTPTPVPTSVETMPTTGIGDTLWPLAVGLALAILLFGVRHLRTAEM